MMLTAPWHILTKTHIHIYDSGPWSSWYMHTSMVRNNLSRTNKRTDMAIPGVGWALWPHCPRPSCPRARLTRAPSLREPELASEGRSVVSCLQLSWTAVTTRQQRPHYPPPCSQVICWGWARHWIKWTCIAVHWNKGVWGCGSGYAWISCIKLHELGYILCSSCELGRAPVRAKRQVKIKGGNGEILLLVLFRWHHLFYLQIWSPDALIANCVTKKLPFRQGS